MTDHEYRQHIAKSADAFDREIDRYESKIFAIKDALRRQQEKVDRRRIHALKETRTHVVATLLKEADLIERVVKAVRKVL